MVDPLDGTTNFLHGIPHWAISIGAGTPPAGRRAREVAAGLVYAPAVDEMFWAEKGGGAFVNERRLRVSARRELKEARVRHRHPVRRRRRRSGGWPSPARSAS